MHSKGSLHLKALTEFFVDAFTESIVQSHYETSSGFVQLLHRRGNAELFVLGEVLVSQEGTTQGNPLTMAMYALAIVPLMKVVHTPDALQIWFADDASLADDFELFDRGGTNFHQKAPCSAAMPMR